MNSLNNPCPVCSAETVQCDCPRPMNTPTPRTDAEEKYFNSNKLKRSTELQSIYNFTRQLEQELNEARTRGDAYGQKYAACILEREKLKAELKQMSVCLDASNDARALIGVERDQLRKVTDELASKMNFVIPHMPNFAPPNLIYDCNRILSHYSQLPHVKQKETK